MVDLKIFKAFWAPLQSYTIRISWKNKFENLEEELWTPIVLKICVTDLSVTFL